MKNMMRKFLRIGIGLFLTVLLAAGCGYRFTPTGENIGQDVKKVYVGPFANSTSEANIEMTFRNAFIDQFIKGRRFKVVDSEAAADAVLKGDIKNLAISNLAYRGDNSAVELRLTVTMSLDFQRSNPQTTIWRNDSYSQWVDYVASGADIAASENNRKNALVKLANDVADRAYRLIVADF